MHQNKKTPKSLDLSRSGLPKVIFYYFEEALNYIGMH